MSEQEFDCPPATGHAIPLWLRWQFDELELHATHMSGASVFTQMRTKVQAYFEMLRSVERGNAGRELFLTGRAAETQTGPTPLYTAVDMANAARDGFRDGAASVVVELPEPDWSYENTGRLLSKGSVIDAIIAAGGRVKE